MVNVDSLSGGDALLLASPDFDILNCQFDVRFPVDSGTNKAGYVFAHDGTGAKRGPVP